MSAVIQFDLFHEVTEMDVVRAEVNALKESQDKVRNGMFARHSALWKLIMELQKEIEELKIKLQNNE